MKNVKKWEQFLNEGIFDFFKRDKFEKLEKLMKKMDANYEKLVNDGYQSKKRKNPRRSS